MAGLKVSPPAPDMRVVDPLSLTGFYSRRHEVISYPWTMAINEPIGAFLAYLAYCIRLRPNAITMMAGLASTAGAVCFYAIPKPFESGVWAFVLLQLGYSLDCADGQLARGTHRTSRYGAWLDVAIDFWIIIVVVVAAAAVSYRGGSPASVTILSSILAIYGRTLHLHTSTVCRAEGGKPNISVSNLVRMGRLMLDTGFYISVICILRALPQYLPWAIGFLGAMQIILAIRMARKL